MLKVLKEKIIYSFVSDEEGPYGLGTNFLLNDGLMNESNIAIVTGTKQRISSYERTCYLFRSKRRIWI